MFLDTLLGEGALLKLPWKEFFLEVCGWFLEAFRWLLLLVGFRVVATTSLLLAKGFGVVVVNSY